MNKENSEIEALLELIKEENIASKLKKERENEKFKTFNPIFKWR
jgi:hypothetical protein